MVGAGAAGAVVAARLAEDGKRSAIIVEAGPDNTADPTVAAAAKFAFLYDMPAPVGPNPSPTHWGFMSPQNGKTYCYPRGTGLGGSTNHHASIDGRGSPLVYDEWVKQTGDVRWSYQSLLPFFIKMENFSDIPYDLGPDQRLPEEVFELRAPHQRYGKDGEADGSDGGRELAAPGRRSGGPARVRCFGVPGDPLLQHVARVLRRRRGPGGPADEIEAARSRASREDARKSAHRHPGTATGQR